MSHKIRLGPIAIFLTVIAAVLATLAILSVATSRADLLLAERFAKVTQIRYALEEEGSRVLMEIDGGGMPDGASYTEDGAILYASEREGYALTVEAAPKEGGYDLRVWKIEKIWETENTGLDLWPGL